MYKAEEDALQEDYRLKADREINQEENPKRDGKIGLFRDMRNISVGLMGRRRLKDRGEWGWIVNEVKK